MGRIYKSRKKMPDGSLWESKRWYAEWTDSQGKQRKKAVSESKTEAKATLKELEGQAQRIRLGLEQLPEKKQEELTLLFLRHDYLADARLRLRAKTIDDYEENFKALFEGVREHQAWLKTCKKPSDLTPSRIRRYQIDATTAKLSPRNINKRLRSLQILLNWAVEMQLITENPIRACKMLPERPKTERRPLTEEEIERLIEASDEHAADVWTLLIHSGLRKGELTKLAWSHVDIGGGYLEVRAEHSKNHRARIIPLSKTASKILKSWKKDQHADSPVLDHIGNFKADTYWGIGKTFKRYCKDAKIKGVSLHSLRRTFTVRLLEAGTNPSVVQALLGHSTVALTMEIYGRARKEDIDSAIGKLDKKRCQKKR